jgi:peptidoglycan/LPS O-acetylase OafA/YrhL
MGSHLFPGPTLGILRPIGAIRSFGATGVDLFFVLSGFLITGILYDSVQDPSFFRKFYARRILRIFPLYYGVLFSLILLTPWLGIHWGQMKWTLLFYLQNTGITGPFYAFHMSRNVSLDHFWTLAVEEQFYLVWPLAVFFIRDLRKLLWTCLALSSVALALRFILAFHHTNYNVINRITPCRADSLLIGAALALLLRSTLHDAVLRSSKSIFFVMVSALVVLNLIRLGVERRPEWLFPFDASYLALRYTMIALASAALIAWSLRTLSGVRTAFENKTLRLFGKYSYGLYVLHFIFLGFLIRTFRGWVAYITPSKIIATVISGFLAFGVAIVAAYLSYNLYEKRFLRLKRYFDYKRPLVQAHPPEKAPSC